MVIDARCYHCEAFHSVTVPKGADVLPCPSCTKNFVEFMTESIQKEEGFNQCVVCGSTHTFRQKDFNRKLGVALIVVGVALAYFTYGISLVVVTLIDWLLVRKVGEVGCCYRCGAQFRSSPLVEKMQPFNLVLHDYYRNLRDKPTDQP